MSNFSKSKARKTVQIKSLLEYANNVLAEEKFNGSAEQRKGVILMIESALQSANAYFGFRYLNENDLIKATPGIRHNDVNMSDSPEVRYAKNFADIDETRRCYY